MGISTLCIRPSQGSRTPVWLNMPRSQWKDTLTLALCCLLPGGGAWLLPSAAGALLPGVYSAVLLLKLSLGSPRAQSGFTSACWIGEKGPKRMRQKMGN